MPEQEYQEQSRRTRKGNKSRLPFIFLVTVLLLALAGAGLYLYSRPKESRVPVSIEQQTAIPEPTVAGPEKPGQGKEQESAPEGIAPGTDSLPEASDPAGQCTGLAKKLHGFFQHLDQQDYLSRFPLNGPAQAHFIGLADKLLANPPVVAREADDLYTILQNTAHFFRVIGKENIQLIKTILEREQDKIEDVAGDLFRWLTAEGCQEELLPFSPPLVKVYEYAGFFLNTLGGRSYLFRRDARTRLLVTYYAVLIIDRANVLGINHHGIDISQPIRLLIPEIESSTQLARKENYLDRLYQLQERLPQQNNTAE
ncbi:MAG: hypothetical protein ACYC9M_07745 [Desulfobulbaceae bacterium]